MSETLIRKADYLFEVSWEVCNKVGGIHTVISTKVPELSRVYNDNYIVIGPDVWKETRENPEFIEDRFVYKAWREYAESQGLKIRLGRWSIARRPLALLVDFTPYFHSKDKILTDFWETYKVDSLSGDWDYVEPALFGYAAARAIESFYEFNMSAHDKFVAHFHEWMTGSGVLYLKKYVPQASCVFTTHATVVGRSIAGNNLPLYTDMELYQGDNTARRFGVMSKHSMEKSAAHHADALTTVSENTAEECRLFLEKPVDVVTPNGFDDSFVPDAQEFGNRRNMARVKLLQVARSFFNQSLPDDSFLSVISGRYEFRNKGIDLYLEALAKLNSTQVLDRPLIAYIMVPANTTGPNEALLKRLNSPDFNQPFSNVHLTHGLYEPEHDPILRRVKDLGLTNDPGSRVKVIFVPSYLNGNDGIFNFTYYELLIGFDLSVFPSYYEPWGYTPLESLAFHVPTVTTSLAGFGRWIRDNHPDHEPGAYVIERNDTNDADIVSGITRILAKHAGFSQAEQDEARARAHNLSRIALWKNLVTQYFKAYSLAIEKSLSREELYRDKLTPDTLVAFPDYNQQNPTLWNKILVKQSYPAKFTGLKRLSRNLWWVWNPKAIQMFRMINPDRWIRLNYNPIALMESLSVTEIQELEQNQEFMKLYEEVYAEFEAYMEKGKHKAPNQIAYFSMEYGLHDTVQIFSGGLGMLAGDYLKEASDDNANMVAVGLLYRYGYFKQQITKTGEQISSLNAARFTHMPLKPVRNQAGEWIMIQIALPGRNLYAKVWKVDVGRVPLYLLDTDIDENSEADKLVTSQLYGGDWENRFKQELLLGVGGIRVLKAIGHNPDLYHCNEGHAAFIGVERLRDLVQNQKFSFEQAFELVKSSTLFTTHTPVPAGHDAFNEDLLRTYIPHYADRLNITWNTFMNFGRYIENKQDEKFSMSVLAARLSQEMNGVSLIHGRVSREMFAGMYEGYFPNELHISHVTNGIHLPTWTSPEWQQLYRELFGDMQATRTTDETYWNRIYDVPDATLWEMRNRHRKRLIDYLKVRLEQDFKRRGESPKVMHKTLDALNPDTLTIGFARRFATYKRAHLLFTNLELLSHIVNNETRPVQFIYAGKAHPADQAGQEFIKKIVEVSQMPQFLGKIIFVENYDMTLASYMVQGVDVWLNTPTRPLEASGTSGEKAVMNGVVNFSVLDGWWAVGYKPGAGWALAEERTYDNQTYQDALDTDLIYRIIESEIVPAFYNNHVNGYPATWISHVKNTIAQIAPHFTMSRMLQDYYDKFYDRMYERLLILRENNYEQLKMLASWKRRIVRSWDSIDVVKVTIPDSTNKPLKLGDSFMAEVILDLNELNPNDVGVEIVFANKVGDVIKGVKNIEQMNVLGTSGSKVTYFVEIPTTNSGVFDYAFRAYPKHPLLPHRQDLALVKWIS